MPLFEYRCNACGIRFEFLTRDGQVPVCPSCDGRDLEKQLSVFAVGGYGHAKDATFGAPGPCGTCGHPGGQGACSMN